MREPRSASISPPSMPCSPDLRRPSKKPDDPAAPAASGPPRRIHWSTISTGTRTPGSKSGAASCDRGQDLPAVLQGDPCPRCLARAVRPSACALARPAACRIDPARGRHHHWRASCCHQSRPQNHSVDGGVIATARRGCSPSPTASPQPRKIGLKEHGRLTLAKTMMDRKLEGRRTSSKLPELVELVMAKPLVSAGMVAKTLEITPQAARRIVSELGFEGDDGEGKVRAWGIFES